MNQPRPTLRSLLASLLLFLLAAATLSACATGEQDTSPTAQRCLNADECPSGFTCDLDRALGSGTWCVATSTTTPDTSDDDADTSDAFTNPPSDTDALTNTDTDALTDTNPTTDTTSPSDVTDTADTNPPADTSDTSDTSDTTNPLPVLADCTNAPQVAGFVCIPAGTFQMGSPPEEVGRDANELLHAVEISRPFLIKRTEVTQAEWRALMENNPSVNLSFGDVAPVDSVSWYDTLAFANALSARDGLPPCYDLINCTGTPGVDFSCATVTNLSFILTCDGYRLPTEAEWEKAARGGSSTAFHNGDDAARLNLIAWFDGNALNSTHAAAQMGPNPLGVHDMSGNVFEWVWDPYLSTYYSTSPAKDPRGPSINLAEGNKRGARGGAYNALAPVCRSAARFSGNPSVTAPMIGFRVVRSLP